MPDWDLIVLELEYRADEEEDRLLQFVVDTFPHLTSLKPHRCHSVLEKQEKRDVSTMSDGHPIQCGCPLIANIATYR